MSATRPCPICGAPVPAWDRYPALLCPRCVERAHDEHGRPMRFRNESALGGGFVAEVEDERGLWRRVEGEECWVEGRRCMAGEHRFGGIAVQAAEG